MHPLHLHHSPSKHLRLLLILIALGLGAGQALAAPVYSALGASDAVGYGAIPESAGYVFRIADWLTPAYGPWTLRNRGVSGYTAPDIRDNSLPAAIADDPTLVTLWVGGDDVTHSVLRGEPTAELQTHFQDAYSTIIRRLRTETSALVVTANIPDISRLPIANLLSSADRQTAHNDSLAVNAIIAQVCAAYNVSVVDVYSDPAAYDSSNLFWDGFHPNNRGYGILAQRFEAVIGPVLLPHSLGGRITTTSGAALPGVTVTIAHNGASIELTTDRNGFYILGGVGFDSADNGLYIVTPRFGNYIFTPARRSVDVEGSGTGTLNFIAELNVTISGTLSSSRASGGLPLPNVGVLLVNRTQLSAFATALVNPAALISGDGIVARTRTDAAGHYAFRVQPGVYYVVPLLPGTVLAPVLRGPLTIATASLAGQDFIQSDFDRAGPGITCNSARPDRVSGLATDSSAGLWTVVVTLQNDSNAYLNWLTPNSNLQFTPSPVAASYELASLPGTAVPLLNLSPIAAQLWTIALPRDLPPGTYRVTVRAIDRAARASAPVSRTFVKPAPVASSVGIVSSATASAATASAATASVQLRFGRALDAGTAADPAPYAVEINGHRVPVESAAYDAVARTVSLALPSGALHAGDTAAVRWNGLADPAGVTLTGAITVVVGR